MLLCGNIVVLTIRFLDVAKFTIVNPSSLNISCKFSIQIIALNMSSLPTLPLKSRKKIFIWFFLVSSSGEAVLHVINFILC
jgi:hypothetical protein